MGNGQCEEQDDTRGIVIFKVTAGPGQNIIHTLEARDEMISIIRKDDRFGENVRLLELIDDTDGFSLAVLLAFGRKACDLLRAIMICQMFNHQDKHNFSVSFRPIAPENTEEGVTSEKADTEIDVSTIDTWFGKDGIDLDDLFDG